MNQKFIESICLQEGSYQNLVWHQERINKTFRQYFKGSSPMKLKSILPETNLKEIHKTRIVYDGESENVEFIEYKKSAIKTLEIIESKPFDYSFKFENRTKINQLVQSSDTDDIIISFNGKIKDSSYANLAFWNGSDWVTPEDPLLEGVKRAQLLSEEKIKKAPIHISDLGSFEKVSLINAMLDLGELEVEIKDLRGL